MSRCLTRDQCEQQAREDAARRQQDDSFAAPFSYHRSLLTVPGKEVAVPMTAGHTDEVAAAIQEQFVPRESDVWVATYPKSGTTWVQEILSLLLYGECNTAQTGGEASQGVGLSTTEHVRWLEALCAIESTKCLETSSFSTTSPDIISAAIEPLLGQVNMDAQRRCFKSHSPIALLQKLLTPKSKIIHDVAVSMWHHTCSKSFGYDGPWNHFLEKLFLTGEVESGPWWDFVLPYLLCEREYDGEGEDGISPDQVITVWYEDLLENPEREVCRIASFLSIPIQDDNSVEQTSKSSSRSSADVPNVSSIVEACSFSSMKEREQNGGLKLPGRIQFSHSADDDNPDCSCESHIRKGGSGGWRKYFTSEQDKLFTDVHAFWLIQYNTEIEIRNT